MNKLHFTYVVIFLFSCSVPRQKLKGEYLGQIPPGNIPQLFAPGIVNDGIATRDITFTSDGKEIYFCKNTGNSTFSTLLFCKETEKGWSEPEVVSFAQDPNFIFIEPFISPNGEKLFFVSNMGNEFTAENRFITDIWVTDRIGGSWGRPYKLDTLINSSDSEFFPTVAANGNLYFSRENAVNREGFIYKSELKNGKYLKPEKLPIQINSGIARFNAVIAKDESFMIIPVYGMEDTYGSTDYYISFFEKEKGWSEPLNLGDKINTTSGNEYSAGFSPDDNYFFFMSARIEEKKIENLTFSAMKKFHLSPESGNSNIYWMKADFIKDLKEKAIFNKNKEQ